jgi:hypothetical protein
VGATEPTHEPETERREEAGHVTIVTSRTGRTEGLLPHARRRWAQPAGTSILYSYGSARLPRTGSPAWQPRSVYARAGTRAPGPPPRVLAHAWRFPRPHTDTRAGMAVTGLRLEGSRVPDWPVPALASECGPVHLLPPSIFFFLLLFYKERACFFIRTKKRSFLRGCQRRDRLIVL